MSSSRLRSIISSPGGRLAMTCLGIALFVFAYNTMMFGFDGALVKVAAQAPASLVMVCLVAMLAREKSIRALAEAGHSAAEDELRAAWTQCDRAKYALHERTVEVATLTAKLAGAQGPSSGAACEEMQAWANEVLVGKRDPSPDETHVDMMALDGDGHVLDMHFGGARPSKAMWERLARAELPMVPWEEAVMQWPFIDRAAEIRDAITSALIEADDEEKRLPLEALVIRVNELLSRKGTTPATAKVIGIHLEEMTDVREEDEEWFIG